VLWSKVELRGATCQGGQLARVAGRPSFLATPTLGIGCPMHWPSLTCWQSRVWKGANTWPHHPLVSYSLWLCLILDILKICRNFGPNDAFPSSDVPKIVDQQNSWNSLVIRTYLLYLEWNVGMLAVNICILWLPTIASLNRFISKLAEHSLPFFTVLRGSTRIEWGAEQEKAFESLKSYLKKLSRLYSPE
jgi:hypothetical protein